MNVSYLYFCWIDLCDLWLKGNEFEYFVFLCGENVFYIVNNVNLGNWVLIVVFFLIYVWKWIIIFYKDYFSLINDFIYGKFEIYML